MFTDLPFFIIWLRGLGKEVANGRTRCLSSIGDVYRFTIFILWLHGLVKEVAYDSTRCLSSFGDVYRFSFFLYFGL